MEFKFINIIEKKLVDDYTHLSNKILKGLHSISFPEDQDSKYYKKFLKECINQEKSALLVVYEKEDLVATGFISLSTSGCEIQHFGTISKVMVIPNKQGNNIGRKVMEVLEEKAKKLGYTHLKLQTGDVSHIVHFYKKCGYKVAGVIPEYILYKGTYHSSTIFYKKLI